MSTGRLHPRLGRQFAKELWEERRHLTLHELRGVADTTHPLEMWPAVGAERIDGPALAELGDRIRRLSDELGWPELPSVETRLAFDRGLSRLLIETESLFPAEAAVLELWSFLALVVVPDVIAWRTGESNNYERWVGVDLTRHTLAKQYWRAFALTTDPESGGNAWKLFDSLGEADFDQIQTRRAAYGVNPKLSRAIARAYMRIRERSAGADSRLEWREFLKSVSRLGAFVNFAALPNHLIDEVFVELGDAAMADARATGETYAPAEDDFASPCTETINVVDAFDDLPLKDIVVRLVQVIREADDCVAESDLDHAFERVTGIVVPSSRRDVLRGIAWQGAALKYLEHDEDTRTFQRGDTAPAPDRRWRHWSINSFTAYAKEEGPSDFDALCDQLFAGRANKTVKRIVRAAAREAGLSV
jgi:hypothetical protein